ncbi:NAD-glutamate dehydrogenase [Pseudohoeflea coraliihabitans]|uniref:NAD-glutamate dehydrogenase n=1 Tax=Pseudohoeflea coraliihabitans TaxID=2860393 RepID=A0ABS6WVQ8_9HYPH|nr:NAD-glutamate dehydrogenase [Pseudohoeflea sp. DP4N28-3]MBW3099180.1 NAD-glutamate dehydrogenase [Pseudohoeflea sp. DP4N28-3]
MTTRHDDDVKAVLEAVGEALAASGHPDIDPEIIFTGASLDDLSQYKPADLAGIAVKVEAEIRAWDGKTPRIALFEPDGIEINEQPISVVSITTGNKPFLFDSVMGEVAAQIRDIHLAAHPIISAGDGKELTAYRPGIDRSRDNLISNIQLHMPRLGEQSAQHLVERLEHVLAQVRLAVQDWKAMLARIDAAAADLSYLRVDEERLDQRDEALAFLAWLRNNNFTFLGMREYIYSDADGAKELSRAGSRGLGILNDPSVLVLRQGKDQVTTTPEIIDFLQGPDFLMVTKANVRSVVHRRTHMDYIGVKRFDENGAVIGELRVVGLFTSTAYTRSVTEIPLLRTKIDRVIASFGYDPQSHSGKLLLNTLEDFPRDELFQIEEPLLIRFCRQINELSDRPRVRVLPRIDRFDRFVSVLVYVPRDQYDSAVREKIASYLKLAYNGRLSVFYPSFPESGVARVHFIIGRSEGKTPVIAQEQLERDIRTIVTRWEDRFHTLGGDAARTISVSQSYKEQFSPDAATGDIEDIRTCLHAEDGLRIAFYRQDGDTDDRLGLKIFHADTALALSRRVPLLENLGFTVISEQTHELGVISDQGETRDVILHDMELARSDGTSVSLSADSARLIDAYLSIWRGEVDNDGFNRLVVAAQLTSRESMVLRAIARYLRQAGLLYSQGYIADTLARHADISRQIFDLFRTRFDPSLEETDRQAAMRGLLASIDEALNSVPSQDDDRIIRRFVNVIDASLRTNYFQRDASGKPRPALAFKLNPRVVEGLPEPRPYREIFVYGAEVEGVHLRFGPVARGGLRWSDRAQDYRTEVLGLVKAQQVKNAVIVPVGAKGGFYPKTLPTDGSREEIFVAGREAYKLFIRTLLSVTDNLDGDQVVPPSDTIRHDGDDPYFVVAADKGTATFSDIANAISQEQDFWLDDAFASGGSAGYDHKKMGITARGAWEAVKRHFREMNIDIQTTPFTVAGVGDMSGDVFGNGMLLSRKIRLLAAFDHRDIFIDPAPDPAITFAERQRLFDMPRSSWQDYDQAKLSEGGMIVSRTLKSVDLTAEAAAVLGVEPGPATPQEIMTAILRMQVDLMWFGGIGTYIRARGESDAEVGDRANDTIRVTAQEVRAKVIGEGANLGVTQRGRIAYAAAGGRCNSDAIDNSAGVNSSDVEVNIKIALANAMRQDRLTREDRNVLLASMTDEVAQLVLRNNYLQTLAISLAARKGVGVLSEHARLMSDLESRGLLNRAVETLPDDVEIAERRTAGLGLTRPEIGVLLSYAKIVLFDEIVASDLPDNPYFRETLVSYFPPTMRDAHEGDIETHRLRREIIATLLGNDTINRGGPSFIVHLGDQTGATAADIVRAFVIARDGLGLTALYDRIDALDGKIAGSVQNELYELVGTAVELATAWALKTDVALEPELGALVSRLSDGIDAALPTVLSGIPDFLAADIAAHANRLVDLDVPEDLAADLARLTVRLMVPDILYVAQLSNKEPNRVISVYFDVTEAFRIGRIQAAASRLQVVDHYENLALSRNLDELFEARRLIAGAALAAHADHSDPFGRWRSDNEARIGHVTGQIMHLAESGELTVAKLTVAAGMVSDLARSLKA